MDDTEFLRRMQFISKIEYLARTITAKSYERSLERTSDEALNALGIDIVGIITSMQNDEPDVNLISDKMNELWEKYKSLTANLVTADDILFPNLTTPEPVLVDSALLAREVVEYQHLLHGDLPPSFASVLDPYSGEPVHVFKCSIYARPAG